MSTTTAEAGCQCEGRGKDNNIASDFVDEVNAAGGAWEYVKRVDPTYRALGEEDCKNEFGGVYLTPLCQRLAFRLDVSSADMAWLVYELAVAVHGRVSHDDRVGMHGCIFGLGIVQAIKRLREVEEDRGYP